MNIISAKEALKLSGEVDLTASLEAIGKTIETLAKQKKRICRTAWDHKEDYDFWTMGAYRKDPEWKEAKSILESLGYKVTFHYDCSGQFVDMYTKIEW